MRSLILTDLHAHMNFPFARPGADGLPDRFHDLLNIVAQVEVLLETHHVEVLMLGGDLTHRRHAIPFRLFNALQAAIFHLTQRVQYTYILVGNHDYEDGETHSLQAFRYWPNVAVVDTPQIVAPFRGEEWFMLPYLHDPDAVARAVEQAPSDLYFLGHYATEGVPLEQDYWLPSPLKLGEMAKFRRAFFGHIHKPSDLLDGRVVNVGAPLHMDFGDVGDRYVVLVDDNEYRRIPLNFPRFATSRFPRIPMPPSTSGYLRLQGVPAAGAQEVRSQALALGWRDCITDQEVLPEEVRAAVADGTLVNRDLLAAYVGKRCSELSEGEQQELVEIGEKFLDGM
jgi:DNA repair exonuclease SbcCD nuclease subunit